MKKTTFLIIFMIMVLVFTTWTPANASSRPEAAQAGGVTLTITNNMPKATTVNLVGKGANYTINVNAGATISKTISAGTYKYTYAGCLGKMKKGNLKIKGTTALLVITACPMANVTFYNLSNSTMTLKLTLPNNWISYNISVGPQSSRKYQIVVATYDAVLKGCGQTATGKLKFKKGTYNLYFRC